MSEGFKRIFWGFVFVLLEINVVIDILPDPVGFYFIFSGLASLKEIQTLGNKASWVAGMLIVFSIPTVFVHQNMLSESNGVLSVLSFWSIYYTCIALAKIILVYYIFQLMLTLANIYKNNYLYTRTIKTSTFYIPIMLLVEIGKPFSINIYEDMFFGISLFTITIVLILEVIFLVLVRKYRRLDQDDLLEREKVIL